jgi:predicted nucleic acid-binding protein
VIRILLDTSAYSAYLRGHEAVGVEVRRADELVLTPIVFGELLAGFRKGSRFPSNLDTLRQFLASPRVRWVPLDDETGDRYSIIHDTLRRAGNPVPSNDVWIAASAMQHGLRLLTTDPHYQQMPQIAVLFHPAA